MTGAPEEADLWFLPPPEADLSIIAGDFEEPGTAAVRRMSRGAPLMGWIAPAPDIEMCHIGCRYTDPSREPSAPSMATSWLTAGAE